MSKGLPVNGNMPSTEAIRDFLWPIVAIGGLGAFIDFLIGKTGQASAKDFLLRWWVLFDDVGWNNFGREEGLFAGHLIERWFGRNIWSLRRIPAAFAVFLIFYCIGVATKYSEIYHNMEITKLPVQDVWCAICYVGLRIAIINLIVFYFGFSMGVSFTKFITIYLASLCDNGKLRNLILFCATLSVNYLALLFWYPAATAIRNVILLLLGAFEGLLQNPTLLWDSFIFAIKNYVPIWIRQVTFPFPHGFVQMAQSASLDIFAFSGLTLFSPICRFLLSIIFVGSFLLRPLVMRPVNLIWRRIVESEKPVFTLTFGGAAAFASALSEAAKYL
jgi:hypothetical protein